jgi:predicted RNA-binding Zn-ribbon protein involved in translation (DUF1610 family)
MGIFSEPQLWYCPACGSSGFPVRRTRGSFATELLLWLLLVIPGLIRLPSRYDACPTCGQAGLIPLNSPRAIQLRGDSQ